MSLSCPHAFDCGDFVITESGHPVVWRRWKCQRCTRIWRVVVKDWRIRVPHEAVEEVEAEASEP